MITPIKSTQIKLLKDPDKQIKLNPFIIYFFVTGLEMSNYRVKIKEIQNEYNTRGSIFKIHVVNSDCNYSNTGLTDDVVDAMDCRNTFVRLMDDADGNFYYVIDTIDFGQPLPVIHNKMQGLIDFVYRNNIAHLDERIARGIFSENPESLDAIKKMRETFNDLLHDGNDSPRLSSRQYARTLPSMPSFGATVFGEDIESALGRDVLYNLPPWSSALKRYASLDDNQLLGVIDFFNDNNLAKEFNIPQGKDSDTTAENIGKNQSLSKTRTISRKISTDGNSHNNISVEIAKVPTSRLRNGQQKMAWGVIFSIGNDQVPVYFGDTSSTMIYICTLLRKKCNEHMYRHEFYNNSKGRDSKFKLKDSTLWLHEIFKVLTPKEFKGWITAVRDNDGRPLNQGKANANTKIKKALTEEHSEVFDYCEIKTIREDWGDSYFDINIAPNNIRVPEEFMTFCNNLPIKQSSTCAE